MSAPVRFGVLSYLNCLPATLALEEGRIGKGRLSVERGTPAELNAKMRTGELDVSVVSAAEYLANPDLYRLLEGFSLWCDGPVQSVCLYSPFPREELHGKDHLLGVTPESATSVALSKLLIPGAETVAFRDLSHAQQGLERGGYQAILLIGDKALEPPGWTERFRTHDLGQWWKDVTSLPMTYAVWVARADLDQERFAGARELLSHSVEWGEAHFDEVLQHGHDRSGVSLERLDNYLSGLRYRTDSRSQAGFDEFRRRLRDYCAV